MLMRIIKDPMMRVDCLLFIYRARVRVHVGKALARRQVIRVPDTIESLGFAGHVPADVLYACVGQVQVSAKAVRIPSAND